MPTGRHSIAGKSTLFWATLLGAGGVITYYWWRSQRTEGPLYIEGEVQLVPGKRYEVTVEHTGTNADVFRADLIKDLAFNNTLCIRPFEEPGVTTFRMTSKDSRKLLLPQEILPGVNIVAVQEIFKDGDVACYKPPALVS